MTADRRQTLRYVISGKRARTDQARNCTFQSAGRGHRQLAITVIECPIDEAAHTRVHTKDWPRQSVTDSDVRTEE